MKDWTGNSNSIWKTLGASNHTDKERQTEDYYATDSSAIDKLFSTGIKLSNRVLEPACGEGHLSKRLEEFGYSVLSTDLIDRGYGKGGVDFLKDYNEANKWDGDIITNPPFKFALQFVKHGLKIVENGRKVIMFLKITFLEGVERGEFFKTNPPKKVLVFSKRIMCAKNGNFEEMKAGGGSAVAYAWFIWEKGFQGKPEIEWI